MKPVEKALWFIESHFSSNITLSDIAHASGVSCYYLLKIFGVATGYSVMGYVRSRRLSEAARQLAAGAPDILTVALDACYSSHEAFTRAFLNQFRITPKQVRLQKHLNNVQLVEPNQMNEDLIINIDEPRIENADTFLVAGLGERYTFETNQGIPRLWERFGPYISKYSNQIGNTTYGVCCNSDDEGGFDYIACVEVSSYEGIPKNFHKLQIPAQKYAVFLHSDHISSIRKTVYTIWSEWLPNSRYECSEAPDFERYDERFDPQTGTGVVEIWIPIC